MNLIIHKFLKYENENSEQQKKKAMGFRKSRKDQILIYLALHESGSTWRAWDLAAVIFCSKPHLAHARICAGQSYSYKVSELRGFSAITVTGPQSPGWLNRLSMDTRYPQRNPTNLVQFQTRFSFYCHLLLQSQRQWKKLYQLIL